MWKQLLNDRLYRDMSSQRSWHFSYNWRGENKQQGVGEKGKERKRQAVVKWEKFFELAASGSC